MIHQYFALIMAVVDPNNKPIGRQVRTYTTVGRHINYHSDFESDIYIYIYS